MLHERGHDFYVVDLPGHGASRKPTRPDTHSTSSTAEQLERLFVRLGLERPHVVGNSLGGIIAANLFVRATSLGFTKDVAVLTTIAWGDTDRLLLPSEAGTARARLPEATHISLPDCGRCRQIDDPRLVVDVALATFARAGGMEQRLAG